MPQTLSDWLEYIEHQHPNAIEMGLDRVREVHARLGTGRPGRHVVTVGGTNGKGSTVALVEAIARAAGLRTGAYTSPHLLRYNERVRIDGEPVPDEALVAAFAAVEAARGDIPLTYFEFGTLAALRLFADAGLDLAVLEVGLGGRLDATNIVDPDVAVITTVDLDHQDWLGPDVESIGREKVGIARAWKPLVLGDDDPPSSVLRHAYAIGAKTLRIGCDFFVDPADDAGRWRWREVGHAIDLPPPGLVAPAQRRNAALAITALRALDLHIGDDAMRAGVAGATVAGRIQRLEMRGVEVVLDVAHNPQSARQLAAALAQSPAAGRTLAVFAALGDKDIAGIAGAMAPAVARWHLAALPAGGPRALDAEALRGRIPAVADGAGVHADVAAALAGARAEAGEGDRIVVFGSFHTVAAALRALGA